jgi:hypothetical protein
VAADVGSQLRCEVVGASAKVRESFNAQDEMGITIQGMNCST